VSAKDCKWAAEDANEHRCGTGVVVLWSEGLDCFVAGAACCEGVAVVWDSGGSGRAGSSVETADEKDDMEHVGVTFDWVARGAGRFRRESFGPRVGDFDSVSARSSVGGAFAGVLYRIGLRQSRVVLDLCSWVGRQELARRPGGWTGPWVVLRGGDCEGMRGRWHMDRAIGFSIVHSSMANT
jgi:hypothetical protein